MQTHAVVTVPSKQVRPLSHEEFVRRIDSAVPAGTTRLFEFR